MSTGFLSPAQIARIKAIRARAWNRPFTVLHTVMVEPTEYYDTPASVLYSGSSVVMSGDWTWRGQFENRGEAGGVIQHGDMTLATDILYSGDLMQAGTRLLVDGITVAVIRASPYPDSGEIVVNAVRVLTMNE
jgi:hypothetical protein